MLFTFILIAFRDYRQQFTNFKFNDYLFKIVPQNKKNNIGLNIFAYNEFSLHFPSHHKHEYYTIILHFLEKKFQIFILVFCITIDYIFNKIITKNKKNLNKYIWKIWKAIFIQFEHTKEALTHSIEEVKTFPGDIYQKERCSTFIEECKDNPFNKWCQLKTCFFIFWWAIFTSNFLIRFSFNLIIYYFFLLSNN